MLKKIILLAVLILVCAALCFVRPNLISLQKIENSKNKTTEKINTVDLSKYRDNPKEYFKIAEDKQKNNIQNMYAEIKTEFLLKKYYRKNNFQKKICIYLPKNMQSLVEIVKNKNMYEVFNVQDKKNKFLVAAVSPLKDYGSYFNSIIYDLSDLRTDKAKYIGPGYSDKLNRSCSMWQHRHEYELRDSEKNENFISVVTHNYCVDESNGLILFAYMDYAIRKVRENYFTVEKMEFGTVNDDEFIIPSNIKFIIDTGFLKKIFK